MKIKTSILLGSLVITTPLILNVVSCSSNPLLSLYNKIKNKTILISEDDFWGNFDSNIKKTIIKKIVSVANLSKSEAKFLKFDDSTTNFKNIPTKKIQESKKIFVMISNDPKQYAPVTLTWKLTNTQKPIYDIYKQWNNTAINYFKTKKNIKELSFPKQSPPEINIRDKNVSVLIKDYIDTIWKSSSLDQAQINKKWIILPNATLKQGQIKKINNIMYQNGHAKFPLSLYQKKDGKLFNEGLGFRYVKSKYINK